MKAAGAGSDSEESPKPGEENAAAKPRKRPISTLLLILVMACMLPLAVIFGFSTYLDTAQDLKRREANLHALVKANADEVGVLLASLRLMANELAGSPQLLRLDGKRCDPALDSYRRMFPDIASISTVSADGRVICSSVRGERGRISSAATPASFAQTRWFPEAARAGRFHVSGLTPDSLTGLPVTMITAPMPSASAAPGALIAISLNLSSYDPNRTADPLPAATQTGILRGDGRLVWHLTRFERDAANPGASSVPPLSKLLALGNGTTKAASTDGMERLFGIAPIPGSDLYAYIGVPLDAIYAEDLRSAFISVALGALSLILVTALALTIARRIAGPIASLASAAESLRSGCAAPRALAGETAETAMVAETFNRLVDEWQSSLHRLADSTRDYEDLYQNAPCGYHSVDAGGKFIRMNDTELRWLGYRREEVVGRMNICDVLAPEFCRRFESGLAELLRSGHMPELAGDYLCKDGRRLPVLIVVSAIRDADGRFVKTRSIVHNMSDQRKLEQVRDESARHIQLLSRQLVAAQEEERRRLSSELHDRASANLAALSADLTALAEQMPQPPSAAVSDLLADTQAVLEDTTRSLREVCAELRPAILDYGGLLPALESYARQFERRTGIRVALKTSGSASRLGKETESTLYRIAQEALTNSAKHSACASNVDIELVIDEAGSKLTIADNGVGFDPEHLPQSDDLPGLGLLSMRQRAEFIGGHLHIDSSPGKGTRIVVEF